jgi:hypothetical protein
MKEEFYMKNNKFEKIIFILLRVFGVLTIIAAFLGDDRLFSEQGFLVLRHKTIIGNIYMISPRVFVEMIVSIVIYLVFIRFIAKNISISRKRA